MKFLADLGRAKDFHRFRTLKWVMGRFRNLVMWKKHNEKKSREFHRRLLCRQKFGKWHRYTVRVWQERKAKAVAFYHRHCITIAWKQWLQFYLVENSKKLLAADWYDLKLSERMFRDWVRVTAQRRLIVEIKMRKATAHYNVYAFFYTFLFIFIVNLYSRAMNSTHFSQFIAGNCYGKWWSIGVVCIQSFKLKKRLRRVVSVGETRFMISFQTIHQMHRSIRNSINHKLRRSCA